MQINIWSYSGRKLLHSIDTGHSANIFCTKFIPETSDELVVSGAGDAEVIFYDESLLYDGFYLDEVESIWKSHPLIVFLFGQVRLFNLSHLSWRGHDDNAIAPSGLYQCHTRRVKKLAVRSYIAEMSVL